MKSIGLIFLFVSAVLNKTNACTNFLISKGASTDGSTFISYAADSHELFGELYFYPAADYAKGDSVQIIEWDTYKPLGKIKQVNHTYKVVGNMNEHQLAIGETTFTGREELRDSTGIIDYGSLIYLTLKRAKTAREAIGTFDQLLSEYGYHSTGESFSISDANEVWILELIGKGVGRKGAVWVAQKIPDGYISGHANQSRIMTFPLNDPENCLYSKDVISFAKEKGYYSGPDSLFSFSDAYAPVDFEGARFCESRIWSGFRKVNSNMEQYEDYVMGLNLKNKMPLWIKPDKKISVQDMFNMMRDYFQGTKMDMTKDIGAGPFECIVRWRPMVWTYDSIQYINERAISTQQTGFSFIAQGRNWLPDAIGGVLWFGFDDTYSTVYSPMYCGINKVPGSFAVGNGSLMEFSDSSAFWVFNQVSNFAYTRYNMMIPFIQDKQKKLEQKYISEIINIDQKANALYNKNQSQALALLTDYSVTQGNYTVAEWKKLYQFLFTRFMDGNVKTVIPGERLPKLEQPGYSKEWYKELIEETGNKYLYRGETTH
jgi:dipeptidase